MKYKSLGKTDLKVSLICLGTMTWGEQNTQEEAFEQMDYSLDQEVNFFDTAELYAVPPKAETYTKTETMIGNWFAERNNRDKVILATKVAGTGLSWIRGGINQFTPENMYIFHVGRTRIQKSIQLIKRQTGMAGLHSSDFTRKHCSSLL